MTTATRIQNPEVSSQKIPPSDSCLLTPYSCIVLNSAIHLTDDQTAQLKPPALTVRIAPAAGEKDGITTAGKIVVQRFSRDSNKRVVLNFAPEVLVDREHLSEIGDDTTAYAWISALEEREDGLYATMNCTDIGWEALRNRRLRFPSAVFIVDADGYPAALKSCALTNKHNLKMLGPILNKDAGATAAAPIAANTASANPTQPEGEQMDKTLLQALGLAETADAPAVLNKVKEIIAQVATLQTELTDLKTAALNKEADEFVKANAAKIKDPDRVKAQYVLNKEATVALFGAMAEIPAQPHQVLNRQDAKAPSAQVVLNAEAAKAKARSDAVEAAAKKYNCDSRARAWDLAQRDNPDLFKD